MCCGFNNLLFPYFAIPNLGFDTFTDHSIPPRPYRRRPDLAAAARRWRRWDSCQPTGGNAGHVTADGLQAASLHARLESPTDDASQARGIPPRTRRYRAVTFPVTVLPLSIIPVTISRRAPQKILFAITIPTPSVTSPMPSPFPVRAASHCHRAGRWGGRWGGRSLEARRRPYL